MNDLNLFSDTPAASGEAAAFKGLATLGPDRNWVATIDLGFVSSGNKTVMKDMAFKGPLRVQRPFYPEGETCHVYLLHPPGGMVSGDALSINIRLEDKAHALLTTPSAGKVYHSDSSDVPQRQNINAVISGGDLEWLPQETIIFNGANASLYSRFELKNKARLIAWDMVGLGRRAGAQPFVSGKCIQHIEIMRDGKPLLKENFSLDPELDLLESPLGLMGYTHFGSLFVVADDVEAHVEKLREVLEACNCDESIFAVTHKPSLLIVRGFSLCAEKLRDTFITLWAELRPLALSCEALTPRIWLT